MGEKSFIFVNPARAGMILQDSQMESDLTGKPRASGDDPRLTDDGRKRAPVNPARAGMIPRIS